MNKNKKAAKEKEAETGRKVLVEIDLRKGRDQSHEIEIEDRDQSHEMTGFNMKKSTTTLQKGIKIIESIC